MMKAVAIALLVAVAASGCSNSRGRTTQMFPDCDDVSADEQAESKCVHRPETPDGDPI
jgi:hypothetical protein